MSTAWPSQSDLAAKLDLPVSGLVKLSRTAGNVGADSLQSLRLRDAIYEILSRKAGLRRMTELIASVLVMRGSTFEEPKRTQMASVAVRAALEAERHV